VIVAAAESFLKSQMIRSPRLLVAARALAGLSQDQLAEASGIEVSILKKLEQGRTDPRNSTVIALVNALEQRGVRFMSRSGRVAWGVYVERGSEAEEQGTEQPQAPGTDRAGRSDTLSGITAGSPE
jgi:transcriptional regulator with XRE-family HTH domain